MSLAGVYTISFLGVMNLFAIGNLILRQTRTDLKRPYRAPIVFVFIAFISTAIGLVGNILIDQRNLLYFLLYFIPAIVLVLIIIYKKDVTLSLMNVTRISPPIYRMLERYYHKTIDAKFYVFIHTHQRLFKILEYINRNENGWNVKLIHCKDIDAQEQDMIKSLIPALKEAGVYPFMNLEFEFIDEEFGPEVVDKYATEHEINKNRIFIG